MDSHVHLWRRADGDPLWVCDKIAALDRDFTERDLELLPELLRELGLERDRIAAVMGGNATRFYRLSSGSAA